MAGGLLSSGPAPPREGEARAGLVIAGNNVACQVPGGPGRRGQVITNWPTQGSIVTQHDERRHAMIGAAAGSSPTLAATPHTAGNKCRGPAL